MADGVAITGPTASGKTELAIAVAERLDGEIISMDSRQVYTSMNIGTAKATPEQLARVPHHGIDLLPPDRRYNAGRFSTDARRWISDITARGRVPVLVGGTGFFLRSLTHPMFAEPPLEADRKEQLKRFFERFSREELLRWLRALDEGSAERLETEGGRQRLARAVEVALLTGRALTDWHRDEPVAESLSFTTFLLDVPRDELYARINRRVHQMIDAGLVEEVRALLEMGYDESDPGMNTVGYVELIPYVRGETTLEAAIDEIQRATRRYARRQMTWFRHQLPDSRIILDGNRPISELVDQIVTTHSAQRDQ